MKAVLLLSSLPGAGRTFIAANLAWHLARAGASVLLIDLEGRSEPALHLGLDNAPDLRMALRSGRPLMDTLTGPQNMRIRVASATHDWLVRDFRSLEPSAWDWVLADGCTLETPAWEACLEACGQGLLVERGDMCGARRSLGLLKALEEAHFTRKGICLCYNASEASQPLPEWEGLPVLSIPSYGRALERMAQARAPIAAEPQSALAKAIQALHLELNAMPVLPGRKREVMGVDPVPAMGAGVSADTSIPNVLESRSTLLRRVMDQLLDDLDLKKVKPAELNSEGFRQAWASRVRARAQSLLAKESATWIDRHQRASLERELCEQILGYGPLDEVLQDPSVTEVMVNRHDQVYLERQGKLHLSNIRFWDERQVLSVIERIVAPLGRRIDESSPRVDARLPDGSRVNAIIPPLALKGACLTIRRFPARRLRLNDLVERGSISASAASFLKQAVMMKQNLVVSGGTGSGKTTLLNVLSGFIPEGERIITIEDAAELRLDQAHVVSLESRPANLEGRGEVSIRDLVANSLRMRPDRIVVGECRGGEALDMLQAMNTGHEGSLTTVHANSPRDALARLETLCLMAGLDLPLRVVRGQIAAAIDLIIQASRLKDGSRRITHISEVLGMEGDTVVMQDLFVFRQTGQDAQGRVLGSLEATGIIPRSFHQARENGLEADLTLFHESASARA